MGMIHINPNIPIITLNVNGPNAAIKRQILSQWIKKHDLTICCLQENYFKYQNVLGENDFSTNYKFKTTTKLGGCPNKY